MDFNTLLRASLVIASKQCGLQARQFDVYNKSSSLANAIKRQSDSAKTIIETASILTQQFSTAVPSYSTRVGKERGEEIAIPSPESVTVDQKDAVPKQGIEQDHFYEWSQKNTTTQPILDGELEFEQNQATQTPLPDGTILPRNSDSAGIMQGTTLVPESYIAGSPKHSPEYSLHGQAIIGISKGQGDNSILAQSDNHAFIDRRRDLQYQAESQRPEWSTNSPPLGPIKAHAGDWNDSVDVDQGHGFSGSSNQGTSSVLSSLPRIPAATNHTRESTGSVHDEEIYQDVHYLLSRRSEKRLIPKAQSAPIQELFSDNIDTEITHSPNIAEMSSGGPNDRFLPGETKSQRPSDAGPSQNEPVEAVGDDSFSERKGQSSLSNDFTSDIADVHSASPNISKDMQNHPIGEAEVRNV